MYNYSAMRAAVRSYQKNATSACCSRSSCRPRRCPPRARRCPWRRSSACTCARRLRSATLDAVSVHFTAPAPHSFPHMCCAPLRVRRVRRFRPTRNGGEQPRPLHFYGFGNLYNSINILRLHFLSHIALYRVRL